MALTFEHMGTEKQCIHLWRHFILFKPVFTFQLLKTKVETFDNLKLMNENELEFLRLASTDLTYKEIAAHLNLSPRAIDGYRDILFEKLDVKSRVGLDIYAVNNGIVMV